VSHNLPIALNSLLPPDPPADTDPDGGASGTLSETSTPPSIVVIVISLGKGTGERFELSMVQLSAMVGVSSWVDEYYRTSSKVN
jgi:hypothetical protein